MGDAYVNFAVSTVATPPSPAASGVTLTVTAGQGVRFGAIPCNVTIWPAASLPEPNTAEIARVTGRAGDVLTLVRAQESTAARTIVAGDLIAQCITKKFLDELHLPVNLATDVTGSLPPGSLPAHHTTHESGGADAVTLTEAQVTNLPADLAARVTGPASSTQNGIVRFADTTGKVIKDASGATVNNSGFITVPATSAFNISGRLFLYAPADGVAFLVNSAGTDLAMLKLGGQDAGFPALKRNGAGLDIRLADDSAYAALRALLSASDLTSGTVPDARFPATLPAVSGANLTNLDAGDLTTGTVPDARLSATIARIPVAQSDVTNLVTALAAKAPLASPAFTGTPSLAQLAFPATAVPSVDPNTLDDYEEGTFLPFLTTDATASGQTYASRVGNYTKIGRWVIAQYDLTLSAKGTMTGNVVLSGFPAFGASATVGSGWFPIAWHLTATAYIAIFANPAYSSLSGWVQSYLYQVTAATTSAMGVFLQPAALNDTTRLAGTVMYFLG